MKKFLWTGLIFSLMSSLPLMAQTIKNKVGTAGFQFLKLGVGGRDVALGGATTATAEGPTALYWNPAGICADDKLSATFFYNAWIATIHHNFIGFKTPLSSNDFIGASVNFITMDDMEETTIEQPQGTGRRFSAYDFAVALSYGRRITDRFSAALSVKYINERIWDLVADGWAFDVGFIYRFYKLRLGMSFNNFGTEKEISGTQLQLDYQIFPDYKTDEVLLERVAHKIRLPINFRFGAGYELLKLDDHKLVMMGNIVYFNDIGETGNTGVEYTFMENYALRGGYQFNREGFDWSFGGGVRFYLGRVSLFIDYAAVSTNDFGFRHQTGVIFSF
ncbi:MAG: PorV/PorQ family protein [candidate division KSB1 bacterium]|nr:PorV/PorQ family protein [candidate division KSB1 bacterium]